MNMKALLLVVAVSVCCYHQSNGTSANQCFADPFGGKSFTGVSLHQCRRFCLDATLFQCQSFMYNSIGRDCILSETKRTSPPSSSGYNNYQYFERSPACNPVAMNGKIASCTTSNQYSTEYGCAGSYDGNVHATGAQKEWAMAVGKGVGEWMQLELDSAFVLTSIEIYPRCHREAQFSSFDIHVGNGEVIPVTRTCGTTQSWTDCSGVGNALIPVEFPYPVRTTYVKLEVTGVCFPSKLAIGIREINLFGF